MAEPPLPPVSLMRRVGRAPANQDQAESFLEVGRRARNRIDELRPDGWSWEGKRVLDFGCGVGRTLRHFLRDAGQMEIHGCDIDRRSIRWLDENLAPVRAFEVGEERRLPQPDGYFDAIWAVSVFTHIDRDWAEWLLELRRVLSADGWLLVTFLGDGMLDLWDEVSEGEPWDPDRIGRAVFRPFAPWREGGPIVFQSEWWIRAHWGRAFTIERVASSGFRAGGGGRGSPCCARRLERARPTISDSRSLASRVRPWRRWRRRSGVAATSNASCKAGAGARPSSCGGSGPGVPEPGRRCAGLPEVELAGLAPATSWVR